MPFPIGTLVGNALTVQNTVGLGENVSPTHPIGNRPNRAVLEITTTGDGGAMIGQLTPGTRILDRPILNQTINPGAVVEGGCVTLTLTHPKTWRPYPEVMGNFVGAMMDSNPNRCPWQWITRNTHSYYLTTNFERFGRMPAGMNAVQPLLMGAIHYQHTLTFCVDAPYPWDGDCFRYVQLIRENANLLNQLANQRNNNPNPAVCTPPQNYVSPTPTQTAFSVAQPLNPLPILIPVVVNTHCIGIGVLLTVTLTIMEVHRQIGVNVE